MWAALSWACGLRGKINNNIQKTMLNEEKKRAILGNNGSNKAKKESFKARNWELIQIFLLQSRFFPHELSLYSLPSSSTSSFSSFIYLIAYTYITSSVKHYEPLKNANIKKTQKRNYLFLKIGMKITFASHESCSMQSFLEYLHDKNF